MKKIYTLILGFCVLSVSVSAAPRWWVGGASGNWNVAANWSATSGGAGGAGVPGAADDVNFNTTSTVNINLASVTVLSLRVTGTVNVKLFTTANTTITVTSSNVSVPGLNIETGSTLTDSTDANVDFNFVFNGASNARGAVNGNWIFSGGVALSTAGSGFQTQSGSLVNVNGTILFRQYSGIISAAAGSQLNFLGTSSLTINRDGGVIPSVATWVSTSSIIVTGSVDGLPSFFGAPPTYGNVIINVPALSSDNSLSFPDGTTILGDLLILNTNGNRLTLLSNIVASSPINLNIQQRLTVAGANSIVAVSSNDFNPAENYLVNVNLDFAVNGAVFSLQDDNTVTGNTTLTVGGNVTETGGTITAASAATSTSSNLFTLGLTGAGPQTVSVSSGSIDNAQNMVQLVINKTASDVTLSGPLTVGRVQFVQGRIISTFANVFTIDDPANTSTVLSGASNASFVSGPVIRHMNAATLYALPVGKGSIYHAVEITPATATDSYFNGEYFNTAYSDLTVVLPLTGVSNTEYWTVGKIFGADARIGLSLIGVAVPGAGVTDALVVAKYNGSDWAGERGLSGTAIVPGNSTTGNALSRVQTGYGNYTFGFGPANALPVKLLAFSAVKNGVSAKLAWEIDLATVPASFEVLKSGDGRNFTTLTTVAGASGISRYGISDNNLITGNNYYRLKMIEKDGTATLSKVVVVINKEDGVEISSLIPTLVTNKTKLAVTSSKGGHFELFVTDMTGRVWRKLGTTIAAGNSDIWLDMSGLSAGSYQVTGYMNGMQTSSIRFVKQ